MTAQTERAGSDGFDSTELARRAGIEDNHDWHVHRHALLLEIGGGIGTVTAHLRRTPEISHDEKGLRRQLGSLR
jgi:hypothetical protein